MRKEKLKVFEMFAGYGGASFGLNKARIDFENVGFSEIDKYAIQCYEQNHKGKNYGDCTKINPLELPDFDLLAGGFPCQSFSVAGKGLGELDTRGTLFNEIIRIAEVKQPKYMLLENVKGLTNKNHKETFNKILSELKRVGYNVHWKVLNSKDFGIPQSRERVWFVCFREIKDYNNFTFPEKEELKLFLKDILEEEVDKKYYLKQKQLDSVLNSTFNSRRLLFQGNKKICSCLTARDYKEPKIVQLNNPKHSNNRVYSDKGLSPSLNTMQGGNRQPFILDESSNKLITCNPLGYIIKNILTIGQANRIYKINRILPSLNSGWTPTIFINNVTKKGYVEAISGDGVSLEYPNSKTRRGRVQNQISSTLQCNDSKGVIVKQLKIRKLTPKECFRLMGFLNDEINLDYLSNTQIYKLAGNGWDINAVSKIFKQMFKV